MNKNKICLIISYWGSWPSYFPFFLLSAARNIRIDFLIFTDNAEPDTPYLNIHFKKLSREDFLSLASSVLGFSIKFNDPYKVCDFKPLYGFIFQEHMRDYQYWGYCDLDMIFGDIFRVISNYLLPAVDILSSYREFMSGPFSLYRNDSRINELFRLSNGFQEILRDGTYRSFDENVPRTAITGFSIHKLLYFFRFITGYFFHPLIWPVTFSELRYQFQCSYKKRTADPENPVDITEIVNTQTLSKKLHASFAPLMITEPALTRNKKYDWDFRWENGKLTDAKTGQEVFAFHFQESKRRKDFLIPHEVLDQPFRITPKGISYE